MNRELIERIAPEAGTKVFSPIQIEMDKKELIEFATEFLARIDAERGNGAAFWTRRLFGEDREFCEAPFTTDWTPLFLSPTIPEGMALVPKSALQWLNGEGDDFEPDRPGKYWWRSKFKELIAAAQGERNG